MTTNYLEPLSAIAQRLKDTLPAEIEVRTSVDLAQAQSLSTGGSEVWVLFNGDKVVETTYDSTLLDVSTTVLYLARGVLPDLERDGEILTLITKALVGFDPAPSDANLTPFRRVGSMRPQGWDKVGVVAYGMLFATQLTL